MITGQEIQSSNLLSNQLRILLPVYLTSGNVQLL